VPRNNIDVAIGAKLQELRVTRRMEVEALAIAIGRPAAEVVEYEAGLAHLEAETLQRICNVLEVSVSDFFGALASVGSDFVSLHETMGAGNPEKIRAAIVHVEAALMVLQGASATAATQLVELALVELRNAIAQSPSSHSSHNGG
jgi:transcriptional regulator with XRE-family HTH domain